MKSREQIREAILCQLFKEASVPPGTITEQLGRALLQRMAGDIAASSVNFLMVENGEAIMCLKCGMVSFNPNDVAQRYCGACHVFLNQPGPPEAL
jgi:hypothetical protein